MNMGEGKEPRRNAVLEIDAVPPEFIENRHAGAHPRPASPCVETHAPCALHERFFP
jgi:hypothetical protein